MDGTGSSYSARLELLRNELEKTWQARAGAIAEFSTIIDEVPGVILAPDGPDRIRNAGGRMNEAINAHIHAVKQYVDLLTQRPMKFGTD